MTLFLVVADDSEGNNRDRVVGAETPDQAFNLMLNELGEFDEVNGTVRIFNLTYDDEPGVKEWNDVAVYEVFTASGNYGTLICNADDGKVVKYIADTDATDEEGYHDVKQLLLKEGKVEAGRSYDVLDFEIVA